MEKQLSFFEHKTILNNLNQKFNIQIQTQDKTIEKLEDEILNSNKRVV